MIPLSDLLNPVDECPLSFKRSGSRPDLTDSSGFTKHLSSDSPYRHDEAMDMEYFATPDRDAQRLSELAPSRCSSGTTTNFGHNIQSDSTPSYSSSRTLPLGGTALLILVSNRRNTEGHSVGPSTSSTIPSPAEFRIVREPLGGEDPDPVTYRVWCPSSVVPSPTPLSYSARKEHEKRYSAQRPVYRCTDCDWAGSKDVERRLHFWNAHNPSLTALLNFAPPFPPRPSSSDPTTPTSSSASDTEERHPPAKSLPGIKIEEFESTLSRPLDERTCPICRTVVSRRHDLKRHMRRHDPNAEKFECPEEGCDYANLQKSNLKFHILTVHRREKLYEVARIRSQVSQVRGTYLFGPTKDGCDWADDTALSLLHLSLGDSQIQDAAKASKKKRPSPGPSDPCPQCGKVMNRQADLKRHVSIHNKDAQDLKCQVEGCHYSTCQNTSFKIHMDGHSGNRPWSCPGCSFRTRDPASLLRHRKRKHGYIPARRRNPALNSADELSTS